MDNNIDLRATADALQDWRAAEQSAAVARRGKVAAEVAMSAAEQAVEAAEATAQAAKAALAAATLAEESASKTAAAAKAVALAAEVDSVDADSAAELADADERLAHLKYKDAVDRAKSRNARGSTTVAAARLPQPPRRPPRGATSPRRTVLEARMGRNSVATSRCHGRWRDLRASHYRSDAGNADVTRRRVPIRIGTSGFLYEHWRGRLYEPADRGRELERYARAFDTVELNVTFYRMPSSATFRSWASRVPPEFVFAVKASRYLTHIRRLRDPQDAVMLLLERAQELGPHLGPILLQLPPDLPIDLDALDAALDAFPRSIRVAVEPRHPSWFAPRCRPSWSDTLPPFASLTGAGPSLPYGGLRDGPMCDCTRVAVRRAPATAAAHSTDGLTA